MVKLGRDAFVKYTRRHDVRCKFEAAVDALFPQERAWLPSNRITCVWLADSQAVGLNGRYTVAQLRGIADALEIAVQEDK